MDDIGLHMAQGGSRARQAIGRGLVALMPRLLAGLATLGTAAMMWVGGQIFLHGPDAFPIGRPCPRLPAFANLVPRGVNRTSAAWGRGGCDLVESRGRR